MMRNYSELASLKTFDERFQYLKLSGVVGDITFGGRRYLNQMLYKSREWKDAKRAVILRDEGYDLGIKDDEYLIQGAIYVHHMNPITADDIINRREWVFSPEFLISSSFRTHQAIHYSDENLLPDSLVERCENDTCPWKSKWK